MISLLQSAGATGVGHTIPFIASVETARFLKQSNLLSQLLRANGQMILIDAILKQNEPLTCLLLNHGAAERGLDTPRASQMKVNTPLQAALCYGNLSLAQIIIGRRGRVTEAEINAIMWRVGMTQDHSVLLRFINMFGPFSLSSPTAVAMAVCLNDEAAVHQLLEAGVDPHGAPKLYVDSECGKILHSMLAIKLYTNEIMGWSNFSDPRNISKLLHSVLELAVIHGNRQILQALLRATTWAREEKGRALSISLHFWDRQFVQDLLDVGADIHQVVLLIDVNMEGPSNPVKLALSEGDTPLLRTLLTVDRIVDHTYGRLYMQYAMEHGTIEQFKILLAVDSAMNGLLQNSKEEPLLQTAVRSRKLEIVSLVLEAGVDINSPPFEDGGMTALQQAAKQGNMELVDLFLEAGANVNQNPASHAGATALQFAAIQGYIGIACRLLDAGASVQAPRAERYGRTALEGAAEHGRLDMLQLLLNEGLLIEGNDRIEYIRAIKLAQGNGHHVVAKFLGSFSDWTEGDSVCYEEEMFDREESEMLDEIKKLRSQTECQDEKTEQEGRYS